MKWIRNVLIVILVGVIGYLSVLAYLGHKRCEEAIQNKSVEEVVQPYLNRSDYLTFEDLPENFVNATVAAEDKRYFTRSGMDVLALTRALIQNAIEGQFRQGGSTIPQQIAKNLYFIESDRELVTRVAEIFMIYHLEDHYSKEELLALYANMNYYGDGLYGLYRASKGYFGVEPMELSLTQCALLAGIVNAPSAYQLSNGGQYALQRRNVVLYNMLDNGYITQEEYDIAIQTDVLE